MTDINHQISILQAFKEGKEIEFRYQLSYGEDIYSDWACLNVHYKHYDFDFQTFEYRVKPEIISLNILKSQAHGLCHWLVCKQNDIWHPELQLTIENLVEQLKHVKE